MDDDEVRRQVLPGPLRYATREAWYAARVSTLYASGMSTSVCNVLSKPLPRLRRFPNRETHDRRLPVLMLHGLAHNQSWSIRIQKELHRGGFATRSVNYSTFGRTVDDCAEQVAAHLWEFTGSSAVPAVHVVAHSIGGVVLRAAVNNHPEIRDYVATAVTVGTPHQGTPWAYAPMAHVLPMVGRLVAEIRPGSATLTKINRATDPGDTRWVSVYSTTDEVVPAHYGRLEHPKLNTQQVELQGIGHYGLMFHERSVASIVDALEGSDAEFAVAWDREFEAAS